MTCRKLDYHILSGKLNCKNTSFSNESEIRRYMLKCENIKIEVEYSPFTSLSELYKLKTEDSSKVIKEVFQKKVRNRFISEDSCNPSFEVTNYERLHLKDEYVNILDHKISKDYFVKAQNLVITDNYENKDLYESKKQLKILLKKEPNDNDTTKESTEFKSNYHSKYINDDSFLNHSDTSFELLIDEEEFNMDSFKRKNSINAEYLGSEEKSPNRDFNLSNIIDKANKLKNVI